MVRRDNLGCTSNLYRRIDRQGATTNTDHIPPSSLSSQYSMGFGMYCLLLGFSITLPIVSPSAGISIIIPNNIIFIYIYPDPWEYRHTIRIYHLSCNSYVLLPLLSSFYFILPFLLSLPRYAMLCKSYLFILFLCLLPLLLSSLCILSNRCRLLSSFGWKENNKRKGVRERGHRTQHKTHGWS